MSVRFVVELTCEHPSGCDCKSRGTIGMSCRPDTVEVPDGPKGEPSEWTIDNGRILCPVHKKPEAP